MGRLATEFGEGIEQQRVALFRRERRDKSEHLIFRREAPALSCAAALFRGYESRDFHAVGDDRDASGIEMSGEELLADRLRYRHDAGCRPSVDGQWRPHFPN